MSCTFFFHLRYPAFKNYYLQSNLHTIFFIILHHFFLLLYFFFQYGFCKKSLITLTPFKINFYFNEKWANDFGRVSYLENIIVLHCSWALMLTVR